MKKKPTGFIATCQCGDMKPLKTPTLQAVYDHVTTALDMLNQRLEDDGLDDDAVSARVHLIEVLSPLSKSIARDAEQQEMGL